MKRPRLLLVSLFLGSGLFQLSGTAMLSRYSPEFVVVPPNNAEATLARGARLSLSSSGIADLILIPGIGDTLASNIIEKKGAIVAQSLALSRKSSPEEALLVVHGIGPKTMQKLEKYIAVDTLP